MAFGNLKLWRGLKNDPNQLLFVHDENTYDH